MKPRKSSSPERFAASAANLLLSTCSLSIVIAILTLTTIATRCQQLDQKSQHNHQQNATANERSTQQLSSIWQIGQPSTVVQPPPEATPEATPPSSTYHQVTSSIGAPGGSIAGYMLHAYTRANNMRAYHLDLHSYRADAKFSGDPEFVDSESEQHRLRCQRDLQVYGAALESVIELDPVLGESPLDSVMLADSFGRPEAGTLRGGQFWLGSYDQCLDTKMRRPTNGMANEDEEEEEADSNIDSQYCLGMTQFPNWKPKESKTSVKVGLCLPVTCTSSMINENSELIGTVERMMMKQFGAAGPFTRLKLREVYCLPHETSQVRKYSVSAICFILLIGALVATSLIATVIDYFNTKMMENLIQQQQVRSWRQILIESFSITRNLNKFLQVREDSQVTKQSDHHTQEVNGRQGDPMAPPDGWSYDRDRFLNTMSGLKCLGLFSIICAHCFLAGPITSKNIIDTDKITKTYLADIYLTAHLMVDTFFAISGMLAAFFLFQTGLDNIKPEQWIVLTVHRYWRLTPIYLICYWFAKSVGHLINSGPMWDYMTAEQSPRLNCARESWLEPILHMSDFKSPKEHCVPFAWFIANGIKFWIVTPIFLILINKSVRQGYMTTISAILTSMAYVATMAMRSDVDVESLIEFKPESADDMLNNLGEVYTRPYSRISPYLIGLLAGHMMHLIDKQQLEVKLSKTSKAILWTLFSALVIMLTFTLKIANAAKFDGETLVVVFGLASALVRPLWALCTCWLVFALAHGQAKWLAGFMTARCWRILVKLSFCAYLAQSEVIAQLFLSPSHANSFTYADMICKPIVITVITMFVSFLMVLLLEYPLIGIEELILPKHRKNTPPEASALSEEKPKSEKLKIT